MRAFAYMNLKVAEVNSFWCFWCIKVLGASGTQWTKIEDLGPFKHNYSFSIGFAVLKHECV